MTLLVVLSVIDIVLLIAGLAVYLLWAGSLLTRIAGNLEEGADLVRTIAGHAELIAPGVDHINGTGGVVAGALPLLYEMAEGIVAGVTPREAPPPARLPMPSSPSSLAASPSSHTPAVARPASGTRRSRLLDAVGFASKE